MKLKTQTHLLKNPKKKTPLFRISTPKNPKILNKKHHAQTFPSKFNTRKHKLMKWIHSEVEKITEMPTKEVEGAVWLGEREREKEIVIWAELSYG